MSAKVVGSDYNSNTVVVVECEQANSMGVLETETCGAEFECTEINGVWHIPAFCDDCTNPLGDDPNIRTMIAAECAYALDNYEPPEPDMNAVSNAERQELSARGYMRLKR